MGVLERKLPRNRPHFLSQADIASLLDELSRVVQDAEAPPNPTSVTEALLEAMERVGIHPALVHGFRVTGFLVSEENHDVWTREELMQWQAAVETYDMPRRAAAGATVSARPSWTARSR